MKLTRNRVIKVRIEKIKEKTIPINPKVSFIDVLLFFDFAFLKALTQCSASWSYLVRVVEL
jgi:hypothetical protein